MRACLVHTHPGVFIVLRPAPGSGTRQNRTRSTCMRVYTYTITKSRALATIIQRIERDVKESGIMQQYSGTPGVKSNFLDYPGKSGRVGRSELSFIHNNSARMQNC